jgi:hypothetical protein
VGDSAAQHEWFDSALISSFGSIDLATVFAQDPQINSIVPS